MTAKPDIKNLSFEDAIGQLEVIVNKFESGQVSLENSIELYTLGSELKSHCEKKLAEAKLKVEKITLGKDGKISTSDFLAE
ncbi:MAG: exodeoxyribonuclease small subunit [Rickettsiaceae bacterium]|jgi:exodeoxyribonuclease VII small subunit|nr:exodeoxyribonuclease small subunit [Rickettsiaceae bacterium]